MACKLYFILTLSMSAALPGPSRAETLELPAGSSIRSQLNETVRMKPGAQVSATLTEPVYLGETLVFPQGTVVHGHITEVRSLPGVQRAKRLQRGDFTPPKHAQVAFDRLVRADGTVVTISTAGVFGVVGVRKAIYAPHSARPGFSAILAGATRPFTEPKKLQRLSRAAVRTLPYHPEFLDRGVVLESKLLDPLRVSPAVQTPEQERRSLTGFLHVRLLEPLESSNAFSNAPVKAVVSRPYYSADHALLFPVGTTLEGTVSQVSPSGPWKRHGAIRLEFRSAIVAGRDAIALNAAVAGVEAPHPYALAVDKQGVISAKNSRFRQVMALTSLVNPSLSVADSSTNKTALSRAGQGMDFGLIGAGIAQTASSAATGLGFAGAALTIYDTMLSHGDEIVLPENTPMLLRVAQ